MQGVDIQLGRTVVTAAFVIPVALLAGCLRTDVLYDYNGNVLSPPGHTDVRYDWNGNVLSPPMHKAKTQVTRRHGIHGQSPVAPHPTETGRGVDVHGVTATPTPRPSSPAPLR